MYYIELIIHTAARQDLQSQGLGDQEKNQEFMTIPDYIPNGRPTQAISSTTFKKIVITIKYSLLLCMVPGKQLTIFVFLYTHTLLFGE